DGIRYRNVTGVQTCALPICINSVFRTVDKKQTAKYIYKLGNKQRMMIIEVPKDQYDEALKEMARKIKGGAVPNESDPNNSKKYEIGRASCRERVEIESVAGT